MVRIAFTLDMVQHLLLVFLEVCVLENWVRAALKLRFVEVVHVELSDERREVVMLEIFGQYLILELGLIAYHESKSILRPTNNILHSRLRLAEHIKYFDEES